MVRALDCGSRGPPFDPGRRYHLWNKRLADLRAVPAAAPIAFGTRLVFPGRDHRSCAVVVALGRDEAQAAPTLAHALTMPLLSMSAALSETTSEARRPTA